MRAWLNKTIGRPTLCARGNWAVKRQPARDRARSRFIDHRARLTHTHARARANKMYIYVYSIIFRITPTPFGYTNINLYVCVRVRASKGLTASPAKWLSAERLFAPTRKSARKLNRTYKAVYRIAQNYAFVQVRETLYYVRFRKCCSTKKKQTFVHVRLYDK